MCWRRSPCEAAGEGCAFAARFCAMRMSASEAFPLVGAHEWMSWYGGSILRAFLIGRRSTRHRRACILSAFLVGAQIQKVVTNKLISVLVGTHICVIQYTCKGSVSSKQCPPMMHTTPPPISFYHWESILGKKPRQTKKARSHGCIGAPG